MTLTQPELEFAAPAARATDPETSKEAARIARRAQSEACQRVRAYLLSIWPDGATDFEIADALDGVQTSLGCRRKDLTRAGLVDVMVDAAGEVVTRPSFTTGSPARVWVAVRCTVDVDTRGRV